MDADVDRLLALLDEGAGMFDEPAVDLRSHGLQCADLLARSHPDDPELIAAGLLHDLADVAFPSDHDRHDELGAELVRPALGHRVARLVGGHVAAKRYLVATDPAYAERLSGRSTETLAAQGGALGDDERAALEASPDLPALLALRRADEAAKVVGAATSSPSSWRPLLVRLAAKG